MINLKAKPFFLDDEGCEWVINTLSNMDVREKVGQLFCEILWDKEDVDLESLFKEINPGAIMYRPFTGKRMREFSERLQELSKIPLLIACNLERGGSGGNGGLTDGTYMASPMGVSATNEKLQAFRLGKIAAREGTAVGINWTFEPIVDIDINCDNPITNVRTFGSDVDRIIDMAKGYMDGCKEYGIAVTIKHFPGDGVDYRDQHLMASVNSLPADKWFDTYGRIYQTLIDYGAQTLMSAHIKQPELTKLINPGIRDEDIMPGSLSMELNQGIIRERMGFNGIIITDATQMAGFTCSLERKKAVPLSIAHGADMFLFSINQREDVHYMLQGLEEGLLTEERLNEAVTRILALKASLKLHTGKEKKAFVPGEDALTVIRCEEHIKWARECADKCITLVKDKDNLLPLSPGKYPKVKLMVSTNEKCNGYLPEALYFKELLEKEGFQVTWFNEGNIPGAGMSIKEFREEADLIIYYANMKVGSNQTSIRLTWDDFLGESSPKYVNEIKTLFLSFSNPYHLVDVPMVKTYINAYSSNNYTVEAMIEKLLGRSAFKGISPVDPYGKLWDTHL